MIYYKLQYLKEAIMKKKFLGVILSILFILPMTMLFAGCGEEKVQGTPITQEEALTVLANAVANDEMLNAQNFTIRYDLYADISSYKVRSQIDGGIDYMVYTNNDKSILQQSVNTTATTTETTHTYGTYVETITTHSNFKMTDFEGEYYKINEEHQQKEKITKSATEYLTIGGIVEMDGTIVNEDFLTPTVDEGKTLKVKQDNQKLGEGHYKLYFEISVLDANGLGDVTTYAYEIKDNLLVKIDCKINSKSKLTDYDGAIETMVTQITYTINYTSSVITVPVDITDYVEDPYNEMFENVQMRT